MTRAKCGGGRDSSPLRFRDGVYQAGSEVDTAWMDQQGIADLVKKSRELIDQPRLAQTR